MYVIAMQARFANRWSRLSLQWVQNTPSQVLVGPQALPVGPPWQFFSIESKIARIRDSLGGYTLEIGTWEVWHDYVCVNVVGQELSRATMSSPNIKDLLKVLFSCSNTKFGLWEPQRPSDMSKNDISKNGRPAGQQNSLRLYLPMEMQVW